MAVGILIGLGIGFLLGVGLTILALRLDFFGLRSGAALSGRGGKGDKGKNSKKVDALTEFLFY